jgi:mRNA-degrading endonuclease RelE of RelBE toxin-antitoxin system
VPYKIIFASDAVDPLQGFSAGDQSVVLDQIEAQLTDQPDVATRHRKRLRPNPPTPWELRIGGIRAFYDVNSGVASVRVIAVGPKEGNRPIIGGEVVSLKRIAIESCNLSVQERAKIAETEPVILTREGDPVLGIVGVDEAEVEAWSLGSDPDFLAMMGRFRERGRQ